MVLDGYLRRLFDGLFYFFNGPLLSLRKAQVFSVDVRDRNHQILCCACTEFQKLFSGNGICLACVPLAFQEKNKTVGGAYKPGCHSSCFPSPFGVLLLVSFLCLNE